MIKVYLLVSLFFKPFVEKLEWIMLLGNEIFFLLILVVFLRMDSVSSTITAKELRITYGRTILLFYVLLLVFNCGIGFISTALQVKELCKKKKVEKASKAGGLAAVIVKRRKKAAIDAQNKIRKE